MKKICSNKRQALCVGFITIIALLSNNIFAQDQAPISSNKNIRFYKVNKDMQGDRVMLTKKKTSQLGCHNFIKQVRVHRAVQTGFIACSVYQDKDCPLASAVPVANEKDPRRTYLLTEGLGWLPQSEEERGVKVKSWKCDIDLKADILGHDAQLAKTEVVRLRVKARQARELADRVQKKADKAKKVSKNAVELAAATLKRAIDAGYKPPPEAGMPIGENNSDKENETDAENAAEPASKEKPKKGE
jgi:hypothetical protein